MYFIKNLYKFTKKKKKEENLFKWNFLYAADFIYNINVLFIKEKEEKN